MPKRANTKGLQFLYLIASGNNDSVYKVGISVDPKARLEQIKSTYRVPNAHIVETMDVPTRQEVFAIEAALHARFEVKKSPKYGGREFFRLSDDDLNWLRSLYREKSNDFAQAQAFYGLAQNASALAEKARRMEKERQSKIDFNRRNGKSYDTKPMGDLKRYNDLTKKMKNGHLGDRFSIKPIEHPVKTLIRVVHQEAAEVINIKTKNLWLQVTGFGFIGGLLLGSAYIPNQALAIAIQSAIVGSISGGVGQAARRETEKSSALKMIEESIEGRYPGQKEKFLIAMLDSKTNSQLLIRDFNEAREELRNISPVLPQVTLPASKEILSTYSLKSYIPKVAIGVTLCFSFLFSVTAAQNEPARKAGLLEDPIRVANLNATS